MKDLPSAQHSHAEHEERENSPAAKQMKGMQNERPDINPITPYSNLTPFIF